MAECRFFSYTRSLITPTRLVRYTSCTLCKQSWLQWSSWSSNIFSIWMSRLKAKRPNLQEVSPPAYNWRHQWGRKRKRGTHWKQSSWKEPTRTFLSGWRLVFREHTKPLKGNFWFDFCPEIVFWSWTDPPTHSVNIHRQKKTWVHKRTRYMGLSLGSTKTMWHFLIYCAPRELVKTRRGIVNHRQQLLTLETANKKLINFVWTRLDTYLEKFLGWI